MILDSDILVDILRGHPPAISWLNLLNAIPLASGVSAIELAFGARDSIGLKNAYDLMNRFTIIWPTENDQKAAFGLAGIRLSSGLNGADAVTAAIALRLNMPVATFNIKHFQAVPNLKTVQPYIR